jgi:hypothetical protein
MILISDIELEKNVAQAAEDTVPKMDWTPEKIKGLFGLHRKQGIRQEELWQLLWIAGLIEESDFMAGGPNHETLSRALIKANEMKAARDSLRP